MTTPESLINRTHKELLELAKNTTALAEKVKYNKINFVMPDTGKYSRFAYPKAMEFFKAGKEYRFRLLIGANGVGKTFDGALEFVYHATGEYPDWWEGKRIENPQLLWIVSKTGATFKSALQRELLGASLSEEDLGTGLIPKDKIIGYTGWPSIAGAVMSIQLRHKKGHIVTIEIKTSSQDSADIQGANVNVVLYDEEPDFSVYSECTARLRGSPERPPGISMLLYTPTAGLTDLTLSYLEDGEIPYDGKCRKDPSKYVVHVKMDEVPHLTEEDKKAYLLNSPPHLIEARINGLPALGEGKIYPYMESQVFVNPVKIPDYWPKCYALDFGHNVTCALWGAKDPATNCIYIYAEYYSEGYQSVQVHALNIKSKGEWIPGICDPSGGGRVANDGRMLQELFVAQGLRLTPGDNRLSSGIARNCNMFENGTLKIFSNLQNTKKEFRLYHYDIKNPNEPAKNQKDHAMDCLRYLTSRFNYVSTSYEDATRPVESYRPRRTGVDPLAGY